MAPLNNMRQFFASEYIFDGHVTPGCANQDRHGTLGARTEHQQPRFEKHARICPVQHEAYFTYLFPSSAVKKEDCWRPLLALRSHFRHCLVRHSTTRVRWQDSWNYIFLAIVRACPQPSSGMDPAFIQCDRGHSTGTCRVLHRSKERNQSNTQDSNHVVDGQKSCQAWPGADVSLQVLIKRCRDPTANRRSRP